MIIECPVCATRYNVQAVFPPEGRPVRCAKCGNVWRATAIDENAEEAADTGSVERSDDGAAERDAQDRAAQPEGAGQGGYEAGAGGSSDEGEDDTDSAYQAADHGNSDEDSDRFDDGSADPQPDDDDDADAGDDAREQQGAWSWRSRIAAAEEADGRGADIAADWNDASQWQGAGPDWTGNAAETPDWAENAGETYAADAPAVTPAAADDAPPASNGTFDESPSVADSGAEGGKVSWFGRFRKNARNGTDSDGESHRTGAGENPRGNTIPFPGPASHAQGVERDDETQPAGFQDETFRSLEDARAAVRGVFASLSEARTDQGSAAIHASPILSSAATPMTDATGRRAGAMRAGSAVSHGQNGDAVEQRYGPHAGDRDVLRQNRPKPEEDGYGIDGDDEPQSQDADAGPETADDIGERLARELQDKLGSSHRPETHEPQDNHEDSARRLADSLWHRPKLPLNDPDAPPPDDNDPAENNEAALADAALEERLAREIEGRRQQRRLDGGAQDENTRAGGLVVAAAWGVFLCALAGLAVAFLSFRDAIADAVPGAAPVYRVLGAPVTVQPLVFENVRHKWALSDGGKPMLVVSGSIVNRAQRKVPVPLLYVSVRDKDPAATREFRTLIQTDRTRIRRGEKADFAIELVGPRPTITAVELEIRNIR